MNKKVYIYIEPYVFSEFKDNCILLYNTFSGKYISENIIDESLILFLEKLLTNNPQRIIEEEILLHTLSIDTFIDKAKNLFLMDVYEGNTPFLRPFGINVMHDKDILKNINSVLNISSLVQQVNIVLGKSTHCKNERLIKKGVNQFYFPSGFKDDSEINSDQLINTLSQIEFPLKKVSIVGDYFRYKNLTKIELCFSKIPKVYYSYYLDFEKDFFQNYNTDNPNIFVNWVDYPYDKGKVEEILVTLKEKGVKFCFMFIVTSENEVSEFDKLSNFFEKNIELKYIPFFNGENMNFFEKNVFIKDKSEILDTLISEEVILSNMKINSNFFGELYFMPDNKVYTNPNSEELGNIDDNWKILLIDNLLNDPFWFRIRDKEPCTNCVYQYLCPSPSNYEIVTQKENFCLLK